MLKKYLKISFIIIVIVVLFYEKIDYNIHSYMIDNTYKNDITNVKTNFIGYIEIDKIHIKREIKIGINDYNLINHVTMNENCNSFDCDNIILAGHSIKSIFGNLNQIKENDIIKLYNGNMYQFKVFSIDIVDKNNTSIIDNSNLILITCHGLNKRIVVKAKRI